MPTQQLTVHGGLVLQENVPKRLETCNKAFIFHAKSVTMVTIVG